MIGFFLLLCTSARAGNIGILTDIDLPEFVTGLRKTSYSFMTVKFIGSETVKDIQDWIEKNQILLVYNLCSPEVVSYSLWKLRNVVDFVHLESKVGSRGSEFGVIYPFKDRNEHHIATEAVLRALGIAETLVFSNDFNKSVELAQNFSVVTQAVVVPGTPQISMDKIVARIFKPEGVKTVVVDLPGSLADAAFIGFKRARMLKKGYAYLVTPKGSYFSSSLWGPLVLAEEGLENSTSWIEMHLDNLNWLLSNVTSRSTMDIATEVKRKLKARTIQILSCQGNSRPIVGSISGGIATFSSTFMFPGNSTTFDPTLPPEILISTHSSKTNLNGVDDLLNPTYFNGTYTALKVSEASNLLGRFRIITKEVTCGSTSSSVSYAKACLARDEFGVMTLGTYSSVGTMAFLEAQRLTNNKVPVIASRSSSLAFSSKTRYPYFVRNIVNTSHLAAPSVQLLRQFGYNQLNLFYSDEPFGQALAASIIPALEFNKMQVFTAPEDQRIPYDFTLDQTNYTNIATSIRNSGVRPVLVLVAGLYRIVFIDFLISQGFKPDEIICIHNTGLQDAWITGTPEQIEARMPFVLGSSLLNMATFIGESGSQALSQMKEEGYSPNGIMCQFYDAGLQVVYSLSSMIKKGKDFEDPDVAINSLRELVFYGCTGKVAIDKDSNDRRDQDTDVFNVQREGNGYIEAKVYVISLTGSQLITEVNSIQWPAGFDSAPPQKLLNFGDCPFPIEHQQEFGEGERLVQYIGGSLLFVTFLITALAFWKWRHLNYIKALTKASEETFADKVVSFAVAIDMLHYIGHGPKLANNEDILSLVSDYASGGIIKSINFSRGIYWSLLSSVLVCIVIWFIFCVVLWLRHVKIRFVISDKLAWIGEVLMPLLGNMLFLPFISLLFDVYYCVEAHGPEGTDLEFTDSYMYRDCYEDCWSGKHVGYAIAASVALVLYHPITVVTRPLWQLSEADLNIITRPTFYLQKSMIEVFIVVTRRAVRKDYETLHATIYMVALCIHLGLSILRRPYNYSRTNLWHCVSISICIWISIVCLFQMHIEFFLGEIGETLLFSGIGLMLCKFYVVVCFVFQHWKLPKLIYTTKHPAEESLYKFAFTLQNIPPPIKATPSLNYLIVSSGQEYPSSPRRLPLQPM